MKCLDCNAPMSRGASHADHDAYQWECRHCGTIIGVASSFDIEESLGWAVGRAMLRRRREEETE